MIRLALLIVLGILIAIDHGNNWELVSLGTDYLTEFSADYLPAS